MTKHPAIHYTIYSYDQRWLLITICTIHPAIYKDIKLSSTEHAFVFIPPDIHTYRKIKQKALDSKQERNLSRAYSLSLHCAITAPSGLVTHQAGVKPLAPSDRASPNNHAARTNDALLNILFFLLAFHKSAPFEFDV